MIDWAQVDELRADMGDAFGEIVDVFLQEVADGIAQLDGCDDDATLAARLHFLKGAALNLGFRDFATAKTGPMTGGGGRWIWARSGAATQPRASSS